MCNQDARAPLGRCRLLLTSTPCRGSCAFAWLWQPSITKDVLPVSATLKHFLFRIRLGRIPIARLAQSAERKALNLVVVGSSPTVGVLHGKQMKQFPECPQCHPAGVYFRQTNLLLPRDPVRSCNASGNIQTRNHARVSRREKRGGGGGIGKTQRSIDVLGQSE